MTNLDSGENVGAAAPIFGRVRMDEKVSKLAAQLEPGDVVVIDEMDLDWWTAELLAARRPAVVLNAATSTSGRAANLGPEVLCAAGIRLIDDLGSDVLVLKDGDRVEIQGARVFRKSVLVAEGKERNLEELRQMRQQNRARILSEVEVFAVQSASVFASDAGLLLSGEDAPEISLLQERKLALICVPGEDTVRRLKALSSFIKDYDPVLIGVDSGAEAFRKIRRKPEVLIGDADTVSDKILRTGKMQIIRVEHPDGESAGAERLTNYALKSSVLHTSLSAGDAAILLADLSGAESIIWVGPEITLEALLDQRNRGELSGSFFVRLRATEKLGTATLIQNLYRPRISTWLLAILMVTAVLTALAAMAYTPAGDSLLTLLGNWWDSLFGEPDPFSQTDLNLDSPPFPSG